MACTDMNHGSHQKRRPRTYTWAGLSALVLSAMVVVSVGKLSGPSSESLQQTRRLACDSDPHCLHP